jgi:hypothetical protein
MNALTVEFLLRGLAVSAEVEAMKADNTARDRNGLALAFSGDDFFKKAKELDDLAARLYQYRHDGTAS